MNQFYGPEWEHNLETIDEIDQQTKREGRFERYLSPGRYALEKQKELQLEEMQRRKKDPEYRRDRNHLWIMIAGAIASIAVIFIILELLVPSHTINNALGEMIGAAILIAGIGGIVGMVADFRRRHR